MLSINHTKSLSSQDYKPYAKNFKVKKLPRQKTLGHVRTKVTSLTAVYNKMKNGRHPKWQTNEKCASINSACFKEFKEFISGPVSGTKTVPSSYDC